MKGNKKVIGLGNKFMMDDGIALWVIENIKMDLEKRDIEVILGETDVDFCFSKLNGSDEFYIIDSIFYENTPGTVLFRTLEEMKKIKKKECLAHSLGLLDYIRIYNLEVKGYFIGIEIGGIEVKEGLSIPLQRQLSEISSAILSFITLGIPQLLPPFPH